LSENEFSVRAAHRRGLFYGSNPGNRDGFPKKKYLHVIRVVTSEKNVGAHKNSERTRKACRGKYIAFCEGDDYWQDSYKLKKQVDYLEDHPECGLVYSSYDVHHCKHNKTIKDFIRHRKWHITENPKLSDWFGNIKPVGGSRVGILTGTVIVRRNLYEQIIESDPYLYNNEKFLMGSNVGGNDEYYFGSLYPGVHVDISDNGRKCHAK